MSGQLSPTGGAIAARRATCRGVSARDRHDVVALGQQPRKCHLGWRGTGLSRDGLDRVDDPQVLFEAARGKAGIGPAEVAGVELLGGTQLTGQEPPTKR